MPIAPRKGRCTSPDCSCEKRLQAILNAMPDLVITLDAHGYYTAFGQNPNRPDLYAPPSTWIGKHQSDVLPEPVARLFQSAMDRIMSGSKLETIEYDLDVVDGSHRIFRAAVTPITNQKGEVAEFCTVIRDVTKERRAGEEIEKMLKYLSGREHKMIDLKRQLEKLERTCRGEEN